MLTLIIGNKNYSSWSLRPWLFMQQMQLDFTEQRVALFQDDTNQKLETYFSNFKVPVLLDGDFRVWDSLAIMEYVSETYLGDRGWPNDVKARAVARSVNAEMHSSFTALRAALPMNCRKHFANYPLTTEVQKDVRRIEQIWRYCREHFSQAGCWLFGEFSIADAMFAPVALRFSQYDVPLDGVAEDYVHCVLHNKFVQAWIEAGKIETEVIAEDEVDFTTA